MLITLKDTKNRCIEFEAPASEILTLSQFALSFFESANTENKMELCVTDISLVLVDLIETRKHR